MFTSALSQISKDGVPFECLLEVAKMSQLVCETMDEENNGEDEITEIPIPNVSSDILKKIIDYCQHYKQVEPMTPIQTPLRSPRLEELVQEWYATFVQVPRESLFDMVAAANFMDIKPLLDLTCLAVSILIKGKSAAELREMFNLNAEFSEEEATTAASASAADQPPPADGTNAPAVIEPDDK